jgi:subtilisin family serine protease
MLAGLMPVRSIGVDSFRLAYPTYDGRGVVIGILDSGLDAAVPGLQVTGHGVRKILDLRDFSGEGRIPLSPIARGVEGTMEVMGHRLAGFARVAGFAAGPYYGGLFREITLGATPAADVNDNGRMTDEFPVVVGRASGGWVVVTDTDGDGMLDDERPVHDYLVAAETFSYLSPMGGEGSGSMTIAVNFSEEDGRPVLDFFLDNSGHGTHVAGIAAGHNMFGVEGFDGVAPGAQLLGLKISNNTRGGISVTGSMVRAMNYAANFARRRALPLVLNLSFGVGNELEGIAAIDSLINEFSLKHPDVLFVISVGNDGPGISSLGFPGSAAYSLSVCALFPGVFAKAPQPGVAPETDVLGWWSARGGEVAKPDVCAPGVAFSNVPPWQAGEEISGGTSMAAPHVAGLAALLLSGIQQNGGSVRAIDLKQAIQATARPLGGGTVLDQGSGIPNATAAYRWLRAAHQAGVYHVQALPDGGNTSRGSAAYRRSGLASSGDTIQRFVVTSVGGQPAARLLLESDTPWIETPRVMEPGGGPVTVSLSYDAEQLRDPGLYVGTVWARPASDTLAGPSFGLTNTVVVPYTLDTPLKVRGMLTPGAVARYFLDVPEGSGGLALELSLPRRGDEATVYLFERNGQPFRGGSSRAAGGLQPQSVNLMVSGNDLVPGVYEAVVVAPPLDAVKYEFSAALPEVSVASLGTGPSASFRCTGTEPVVARVSADLIGVAHRETLEGSGAAPRFVKTRAPPWATEMIVDVELPGNLWHQLTDFGVTVFDSTGLLLRDGPLDYPFGRLTLELDSTRQGTSLIVELYPAFAHVRPAETWRADVQITYLGTERVPLPPLGYGAAATVEVTPGRALGLQFAPVPPEVEVPEGFVPFVEVTAEPTVGPAATRRGAVER